MEYVISIILTAIIFLIILYVVNKLGSTQNPQDTEFTPIINDNNWNFNDDQEYIELMEAYNSCNKQYYDFRIPFQEKLKNGKHLTNTEIITLAGLASEINNPQLQQQLYQTLIEELVLITTSDNS